MASATPAAPSSTQGRSNGVVEALLTGDRAGVGGILCNTPDGLCLTSRGNMDQEKSGIFTNLVRLSWQLSAATKGGAPNERGNGKPLIAIEMDSTSILIKEYDGHTVAMRVPSKEYNDQSETE